MNKVDKSAKGLYAEQNDHRNSDALLMTRHYRPPRPRATPAT